MARDTAVASVPSRDEELIVETFLGIHARRNVEEVK
jgi:hypothetical protein